MSDDQRTPPKKTARRRKRPATAEAGAAIRAPGLTGAVPASGSSKSAAKEAGVAADAPTDVTAGAGRKRKRKAAAKPPAAPSAADTAALADTPPDRTAAAGDTTPRDDAAVAANAPSSDPAPAAPSRPADAEVPVAPAPHPTPGLLLRTHLDVRWGDMDAFNHVNNARFLSYLEEARLRWLQGLSGPWLDDNTAPVLAASHVNFRRPIEWPCTLVIELHAGRSGRSSLTLAHRIVDAADPAVLYSDGEVVMVWIDRRSGKPSTLPQAVRDACRS
jgi:acyl-CoA thioester hydrolase